MKDFVFLLFLTAASFSDIRYHRIDNCLNLAGALAGLFFLLYQADKKSIIEGITTALLVMTFLFALFMLRLLGAGDIKFLMAAVLFTGKSVLLTSIPYMLSAAILMASPQILRQKRFSGITYPAAVPISAGLLFGLYMFERQGGWL